jgi:hypothetical protein
VRHLTEEYSVGTTMMCDIRKRKTSWRFSDTGDIKLINIRKTWHKKKK